MAYLSVKKLKTSSVPSLKIQALAAVCAIAGIVAVPQLFHIIGKALGVGTSLGEILLPMHIPVILAALLSGPFVGFVAGILGPIISFALSGMPGTVMLPFIMIELAVYGLSAGYMRNAKIPTALKVLFSQAAGRIIKGIAVIFSIYVLNDATIHTSIIWNSIKTGIPGIILQIVLIPMIIFAVNAKRNIK